MGEMGNQDTANNDLNLFSQVQSTHTIVNMASSVPGAAISKRRKFVADGVFFAELNEFFQRELAEEGYSGVEVRVTPTVTDIIIRRACYGVLRFIMESGSKGCEVVVSGKLRAARAKSMKFTDGFMIHSGQPAKDFIDSATRHVLLRQGVLGIKVK